MVILNQTNNGHTVTARKVGRTVKYVVQQEQRFRRHHHHQSYSTVRYGTVRKMMMMMIDVDYSLRNKSIDRRRLKDKGGARV